MTEAHLAGLGMAAAASSVLLLEGLAPALPDARVEAASASAAGPDPSPSDGAGDATPRASAPAPAPTHSDHPSPVTSYHIDARLDAAAHTIEGTAVITWRNTAETPIEELWLHQYLEAFAHPNTLFLREAGRRHRQSGLGDPGGLTVSSLVADELDGVDLWPHRAPHSPDDPADTTDIRVPLPRSVLPGEILTLTASFIARMPSLVERTGYARGFLFAGQWFPKLARLEADGTWAHFAFHPQSEFYADFGDYSVALDLPKDLIVGATGERIETRFEEDRQLLRYSVRGVHDFAWVAWDGFRERRETLGAVTVTLLYPPGHRWNADRTLAALRAAFPRFEQRYGPYPYSTLTVVHPPSFASTAGGMEYPTLITTGGPWFSWAGTRAVETVTIHELAHQWFYGLIASNEHDLPLLDEGLTSYAEARILRESFGPGSALAWPGLAISAAALQRARAATYVHDDVVVQPAPAFASFSSIGGLVYSKTAVTLDTLALTFGEAAVDRALARYTHEQRFRHPTFADLQRSFEHEVGEDASAALAAALAERGWVNYVAGRPHCYPAPASTAPATTPGVSGETCRAIVYRHGTLRFPVEIELRFDDGARERQRWDGKGPWIAVERHGPPRLIALQVDPARRIPLDTQRLDDAATIEPCPPSRSVERLAYLAALALGWMGT
ncbi:MAG: M1 family metallopeptidase [Polyangiaceae bacterium]|nr:M1 family metallopeptidase [Polyangiaceae bacterium]